MKKIITIVLVFGVLFSSTGIYAYAGEVELKQLSQEEVANISALDADSAPAMDAIECGESEKSGGSMTTVFAVIGVLVLIGALVAASA